MTGVVLIGMAVMVAAAILQSTVLRFVAVLGVQPDLVLVILVFLANANGSMAAQLAGFGAGVALDALGLSPLGFYAMIYTLLGSLFGLTRGKMFVDPIFMPVLLVVVACVIKGVVAVIVGAVFAIPGVSGQILSTSYLLEIGYSAVVAPVFFGILRLIPSLSVDRRRGVV